MIISQEKLDDLEVYEIILDVVKTALKSYKRTGNPETLEIAKRMYKENEEFKKMIDTKDYVTGRTASERPLSPERIVTDTKGG